LGKGGVVLGLIGLVLAAGGLGLGGLAWISMSIVESQVASFTGQTMWYRYNETAFVCTPSTPKIFSGLTIEFELGSDESVYLSFSAQVHLEPLGSWSQVVIYFRVDRITKTDTSGNLGLYNGGWANLQIHLQHTIDDLAAGEHDVTVVILGTSSGNYIHYSSLFVQRFPT
jgi:hypothetical protein